MGLSIRRYGEFNGKDVYKPIGTLADWEKGREICSIQARWRTRVR